MHLLVAINNNVQEWRNTLEQPNDAPRLPLPYAFGAAFIKRGHKLSAIDLASRAADRNAHLPFETIYSQKELLRALKRVDVAALWGGHGVSAVLKQTLFPSLRRRVILNSYVWQTNGLPTFRSLRLGLAIQLAARFAKAVVVMTAEQAEKARSVLPSRVPVILFQCGIDTSFYRADFNIEDVPEQFRNTFENLLSAPYVIMPGDELRCNADALDIVMNSNLRLVRISQYSSAATKEYLQREIQRRGIENRFILLERISYRFMRALFQHAAAYAGLVDSTWQPAGWTVACEALASGLPIVVYEGLVSRELRRLGASSQFLRGVQMNDKNEFQEALQSFVNDKSRGSVSGAARSFAEKSLDFDRTSTEFVMDIERLMNRPQS